MTEKLVLVAGATTSAAIDGILEGIYYSNPEYWDGQFPFWETLPPILPPLDDFIVAGSGAVPYILGHLANQEDVKKFGEGMLLYGVPNLIMVTLSRIVSATLAPSPPQATGARPVATRRRLGLPPAGRLAPKMIPSVLMPKYQKGDGSPFRPGLRSTVGARPAITVGPWAGGMTAPKFIPGVLKPKYQLGA